MKVSFTFKHLKALKSIENYALSRVEKAEKYAFKPLNAKFIISRRGIHFKFRAIFFIGLWFIRWNAHMVVLIVSFVHKFIF